MKKILFSLMAVALAVGLVGGAFAYFTDTATSATNSFTSGTLSLDHPGIVDAHTISLDNMEPGDVTDNYTITIKNTGNVPLIWGANWIMSGSNGASSLENAIYINYADMQFLTPKGNTWNTEDNFITNGIGSGAYPQWFDYLAGETTADFGTGMPSPFGVVSLANWDGNNGMGTTPYEQTGALEPGYSYKLTVNFGFAALAGNSYQHLGPLNVTIEVDAFQANVVGAVPSSMTAVYNSGWYQTQLNTQIANP